MKKIGIGLEKALKSKIADAHKRLRAGIIESATYPSGESVAQVAFWNEYGAIINVPERTTSVYRSLDERSGEFNKQGQFVRKDKANYSSRHVVPAHTITIPSRAFFRQTINANKGSWSANVRDLLKTHDIDATLNLLGTQVKEQLVKSINNFTDPPNAPSTVAKKGFDAPLRDTMQLARSIDYEVTADES
ncbi:hypothetical protein AAEX37_01959 [Oligella sp. MSHR50489EDL]|uniref:hypothetical protein n=1 Tax=Oligella sp. MSHR50489EDL TaxID=3139409 RepID=UPI003D817B5C